MEAQYSDLDYLRPADYYRGNPTVLHEARRQKLQQAWHRRKEANLGLDSVRSPWKWRGPYQAIGMICAAADETKQGSLFAREVSKTAVQPLLYLVQNSKNGAL
jgi:hypothetical protein